MTDPIDLTRRATFDSWFRENIRFSDTDLIGHVNNVAIAALLESGRTMHTRSETFPRMPKGTLVVMARIEIDYRMELHWPGAVDVGSRLLRVGRSSFVIGQGIFRDDDCITTSSTVLVVIDRATRKPTPMPEDYRQILQDKLRGSAPEPPPG